MSIQPQKLKKHYTLLQLPMNLSKSSTTVLERTQLDSDVSQMQSNKVQKYFIERRTQLNPMSGCPKVQGD
jgi:hypothetical protein